MYSGIDSCPRTRSYDRAADFRYKAFTEHTAITLERLPLGGVGVITDIDTKDAALRRRLRELGILPGTQVRCILESPLGDPRAYRIRGVVTAIRARDARGIRVIPEACGGGESL
ncbi:MAG: FeoA family protein [Clostridiaceae bacterium]|nr:FeoA family protein [Clostridiaceae bacterium]